jgi:hypothetical protein
MVNGGCMLMRRATTVLMLLVLAIHFAHNPRLSLS